MANNRHHIASVSWGKDSLAMLNGLIERGMPLDEVVFYDTGAEFNAIYAERDKVLPMLAKHGIAYTELRPKEPFFYTMYARPVRKKGKGEIHKHGYGWCGGTCRWGTSAKTSAIDSHAKKERNGAVVYVGIAADEASRIAKPRPDWKLLPLVDWEMTEADCLADCYERGHSWDEGGVRLYDILDRVSCWCCRNKSMKELKAIHNNLPEYWNRLLGLEATLGQMKSKPLDEIGGTK